ncbi:MAG: thiolase family protein, partial [Sphingomonadales bacterium]
MDRSSNRHGLPAAIGRATAQDTGRGWPLSDITIAGAYELKPGRFPDLDGRALFRKVLEGALAEWPVRPQDIDGLMTTCIGDAHGYDTYAHDRLISDLNINATFAETINYGGGTHVGMVARAAQAIRAGQCNAVICVSAGKFLKPGAEGGRLSAKAISDPDLEVPYGTFIPALYALILSQFMHERNVSQEDIARVAVSARKWALLNPDARQYGKGELTVEEVIASRWICTPFHFLDCSFPSDGGGAVLVTRADLGRKWAKQPAYVK